MESPASCNQRPDASASRLQSISMLPAAEKEPATSLYSAFLKAENKVGGGEGLEGVYGSITRTGTTKVLEAFRQHASLGEDSVMLDIGSGLGRPLLHAIVHSGVARTYGIEVDAVKCQKAVPFVQHVVTEMQGHGIDIPASSLPKFICAPIEKIPSLDPATHVYAAWEGFSRDAMEAIGKLFFNSKTAMAITIVQRSFRRRDAADEMEELGFGKVTLVAEMPVNMAGSSRRLMAYCFVREATGSARTGRRVASCLAENLDSMPVFQPGDVTEVLASQASERKEAGRARAASKQLDGKASDAGDDTQSTKDRGSAEAADGRRGTRASRTLTQTETATSLDSQASDNTVTGRPGRGRRA